MSNPFNSLHLTPKMDLAILELDVVDFDDLQPVSEQPCDSGKRDFFLVFPSRLFLKSLLCSWEN
jgi:hypothetical protein